MTGKLQFSAAKVNDLLGVKPSIIKAKAVSGCPFAGTEEILGFVHRYIVAREFLTLGNKMSKLTTELARPDFGFTNADHDVLAQAAIQTLETKNNGLALFWVTLSDLLAKQWQRVLEEKTFVDTVIRSLTPRQLESAQHAKRTAFKNIILSGINSGVSTIANFAKLIPETHLKAKGINIEPSTYKLALKNFLPLLVELSKVNIEGFVKFSFMFAPQEHAYPFGGPASILIQAYDRPENEELIIWNDNTNTVDIDITAMADQLREQSLDFKLYQSRLAVGMDEVHTCPGQAFIPLMHQEMLDLFNLHVFPYLDEVLMIDTKKKELEADPQQGLTVLKTRIDRLLDGSKRIVESGPKELTKIATLLREQAEAALSAKDAAGFAKAKDLNQRVADFFECEINHFMMQHFARANKDLAALIEAKEKKLMAKP